MIDDELLDVVWNNTWLAPDALLKSPVMRLPVPVKETFPDSPVRLVMSVLAPALAFSVSSSLMAACTVTAAMLPAGVLDISVALCASLEPTCAVNAASVDSGVPPVVTPS
jgi:hypothetical protein